MSSLSACYFGYGSLVNRDTRPDAENAVNATLKGWRRVWEHRVRSADEQRRCTSLSIEPADEQIDGVLVTIPVDELAALDHREAGYERLSLPGSDFVSPEGVCADKVYLYRSLGCNRHPADSTHPILQSYVDCVMAGYQQRFGDDGLNRMLHTTRAWNTALFNDRQLPRYPRSVTVPEQQLIEFDARLATLR